MIRAAALLAAVLSAALAALLAPHWAAADAPTASVQILPEGELTIGDPVAVQIAITHQPGDRVRLDRAVVQLGGMEPSAPLITAVSPTETLVSFQTRAFRTGAFELTLPNIPVQLADQTMTELAVRPLRIRVRSVLSDDPEPRPLTAPDLLPDQERTLTPWIVAIIGVGVGFILARLLRRRRRSAAPQPAAAAPAGAVRERVDLELDDSLEAAEQCRRLAGAVRARLAAEWPLPASALTAAEIGPALAAAGASSVVVQRATQLLEACERVQFGGEQPTANRLRGYRQLAESIWSEPSDGAAL